MGAIIDILIILIYGFIILLAAKKGFIRTLFELLGQIIAFVFALKLSTPISVFIYDKFFSERMIALLIEKLPSAITSPETVFDPQLFLNILPDSITRFLTQVNIFNDGILSAIGNVVNVANIEKNIVAPILTTIIKMIVFVVITFVFLILINIFARILSKIVNYTPLKKINTALGAVLGALRGLLTIIILCVALILTSTIGGESLYKNGVNTSKICTLVSNTLFSFEN